MKRPRKRDLNASNYECESIASPIYLAALFPRWRPIRARFLIPFGAPCMYSLSSRRTARDPIKRILATDDTVDVRLSRRTHVCASRTCSTFDVYLPSSRFCACTRAPAAWCCVSDAYLAERRPSVRSSAVRACIMRRVYRPFTITSVGQWWTQSV